MHRVAPVPGPARAPRLSPWGRVVAASAAIVVGLAAALGIGALISGEQRTVSYQVNGQLNGVRIDVGDADVTVVRGRSASSLAVQRVDRFAFGHAADARRQLRAGVLELYSRCPRTALHSCSASYRLEVPDNVPLDVRTTSGTVRLRGYRGTASVWTRSGDVDVTDYCGNSLDVRADTGDVTAAATCAPPDLSLRTTKGAVRALVPGGRYQLDAQTAVGQPVVRGISVVPEAPYAIQALSSSGTVVVEKRP
jgi:hypothetical protein